MSQMVPYIPESAPFNPVQREWLNSMLAGLFPSAGQAVPPVSQLQVSVFFATQSGTAERLAKKMTKRLKEEGFDSSVQSLEKLAPADLAKLQHAVFLASTYGEGEPPESACGFRDALFQANAPQLTGLQYTVFCLGDRNYEQFCKFGIDLDDRLHALGAARVAARAESDVDVDAPFASWSTQVVATLREPAGKPASPVLATAATPAAALPEAKPSHTRDNPFLAQIVDKRLLTHASSSKQTVHVSFDLADGAMQYEAGDACGVLAENDPALVAEVLGLLPFSATEQVTLQKGGVSTVEDFLRHHVQVTGLTRKTVQAFAEKAECNTLGSLLAGEATHLNAYLYGRGLIDLLHTYPGVVTSPGELVDMLPRLAPRLYSISSSPKAHGRELHCTVGVVQYNAHGRERGGVASTMLGHRAEVGSRVPIFLQPNKRFRIPNDAATPMIMIGPGTGIAPFRSFLHERQALGHPGRNWLFFGERSAQTDFLYCRELQGFAEDGHLTRFDTAFSRDQEQKVYVQDRILESGAEFFRWLEEGASVYVCGDASRMAKDVDAAIQRVIETQGGRSAEAAQEYVAELNEQHRYHRDVY